MSFNLQNAGKILEEIRKEKEEALKKNNSKKDCKKESEKSDKEKSL